MTEVASVRAKPPGIPDADMPCVDAIDNLASNSTPESIYQDFRYTHRRVRIRRPSIRKNTAHRQGRRLIRQYHEWKSAHLYLARYSIEKMLAFENYHQTTTLPHALAVIALAPFPTLAVVLVLAAIPLQSPLASATSNSVYFFQSWFCFSVMTFGMLMYMRCGLGLPERIYSHEQCALVSVLTAGFNELIMGVLSVAWRFPVPLGDILRVPSYAAFFVLFHTVVFRKQLRYYRTRLQGYIPLYFAQLFALFTFYGVAIVFASAPVWTKTFISIAFPLLRPLLKGVLKLVACSIKDITTELSFCAVDVFGSFFQNVCLQSAQSATISGLIIGSNFAQSVLELAMCLDRKFVVDECQTTGIALKIVESALYPGALENGLGKGGEHDGITATIAHGGISVGLPPPDSVTKSSTVSRRSTKSKKIACIDPLSAMSLDVCTIELGDIVDQDLEVRSRIAMMPLKRIITIDDIEFSHRYHAKLLLQTLELMSISEVLLSSQYFDFACSVIYGLYVLVVYHLPNARYILPFIGLTDDAFWTAIVFYGTSAAVAVVIQFTFFIVVRKKFGFSTLFQLAFVLEKYWMSVQGKLIGCMTFIFILHTVHQGTGFVYGTMFGSVLAVIEGMRAAPEGQRLRGALHHAKVFVPETAGRIAMVTCFFRVAAFGIEELRDKRDMWNTLLAAPVAGAMVKVRHGPRAALNSAFAFGSFAAVVVAFNWTESKLMHEKSSPEEVLEEIAFAEEFE